MSPVGTSNAPPIERFRHHPARAVAGFIVAISLTTLAAVSPWLPLLAVLPLGWMVWVWRAGTDAGPDGLRVRAMLGQRHVPWSQVQSLVTDRRGRVVASLHGGSTLPLTAVTAADLPRLTAASAVAAGQDG
jgi:hypothetical protein